MTYATFNLETAVLFSPFTIFTSVCKLFGGWSIVEKDLRYIQLKNGRFLPCYGLVFSIIQR